MHGGRVFRNLWSVLSVGLVATALMLCCACDGRRLELTEYDLGYNRGVDLYRETRENDGVFSAGAFAMSVKLHINGYLIGQSPQWCTGFRDGVEAARKE